MRGNEYQRKLESASQIKKFYTCEDCTYSTNYSSNLRKHEKAMHNKIKHQKSMQNPNDLRKHEKAMHNPSVTEYHCTINVTALENSMMNELNEYQRKLELGREIKAIALKRDMPRACLSKERMEALELFENQGQDKEIEAVEWRPWQRELFKYVNEPTKRRIIWVVGEKGNEGKSFFQDKIEEQNGRHRVCTMSLTQSSKDILQNLKK